MSWTPSHDSPLLKAELHNIAKKQKPKGQKGRFSLATQVCSNASIISMLLAGPHPSQVDLPKTPSQDLSGFKVFSIVVPVMFCFSFRIHRSPTSCCEVGSFSENQPRPPPPASGAKRRIHLMAWQEGSHGRERAAYSFPLSGLDHF